MFKSFKVYLLILFSASLLSACGENDAPQKTATVTAAEPAAVQLPAETPDLSVVEVVEESSIETDMKETEIVFLPNQVVYQEEIYKNWPYTDAPVETVAVEMTEEVSQKAADAIAEAKAAAEAKIAEAKAAAEAKIAEAKAATEAKAAEAKAATEAKAAEAKAAEAKAATEAKAAEAKAAAEIKAAADASTSAPAITGDKPYQVVDGKISANAMEGWKTYNGGGCGTCHGKGGIGAVGPNLGKSLSTKLSKDDFVNIVTNGVSGTMMRPHNTNKRVMANMDNLYAYLLARGDGVLGPENLIKSPLGK